MNDFEEAIARLDLLIRKARVDFYKPIQIAEVLYHHRSGVNIDFDNIETYRNPSIKWRNYVTTRLTGKRSTSSARYQHDVWNESAMPSGMLKALADVNVNTEGGIEKHVYQQYFARQSSVGKILSAVNLATPESFNLETLLELFVAEPGLRRSIDKAYEIVTYALLETVVVQLETTVTVTIPGASMPLLAEFEDLVKLVMGVSLDEPSRTTLAHIYRVGVTNAADRGLDMWANFGPAVQVKHLTINPDLAKSIVDQVESDAIVIVCVDAEAEVIKLITDQIGWGKRVRGLITQSQLIGWYNRALRGDQAERLAHQLLDVLVSGFIAEFPQLSSIDEFLAERGYEGIIPITN